MALLILRLQPPKQYRVCLLITVAILLSFLIAYLTMLFRYCMPVDLACDIANYGICFGIYSVLVMSYVSTGELLEAFNEIQDIDWCSSRHDLRLGTISSRSHFHMQVAAPTKSQRSSFVSDELRLAVGTHSYGPRSSQ